MLNNVANTVENIANVLSHNARYEDALRMYERTLQVRTGVTAGSPLNGIVCRCNANSLISRTVQCSAVQCSAVHMPKAALCLHCARAESSAESSPNLTGACVQSQGIEVVLCAIVPGVSE